MFKSFYRLSMLAMLAAVASCATHSYHCKTALRAINLPAPREAK